MVSVVVPVYNVARNLLENCIKSICNQTVPCELLLVNDGSKKEETLHYLNEIENDNNPSVRVIHQENHGGAHARFVGIKEAESDYIVFVDQDDELEPDACECMEKILLDKDVDFVQFRASVSKTKHDQEKIEDRLIEGTEAILNDLLVPAERSKPGLHLGWEMWACIFRKDILLRTYDIGDYIFLGPDLVTKTEYLLACSKIYLSSKTLYFYNAGNMQSTTKGNLGVRSLTQADFNVKIYDLVKDTGFRDVIEISGIRSCNTLIGAIGNAKRVGAKEKMWDYRRIVVNQFWSCRKKLSSINQLKMLVIRFLPWIYYLPH